MRIITWNCNMAFARKSEAILEMQPDILVIQECSERDALSVGARSAFWTGSNRHKGLAVLIFSDREATVAPCASSELPWFLPIAIGAEFRLLAVWACVKTWKIRYVKLAHQILDATGDFLAAPLAVATGDFNSNSVWDAEHGDLSHSHMVSRFEDLGMSSAYHAISGETQGSETASTQFMYRHPDKAFHLDYAFVSNEALIGAALCVGSPDLWLKASDHMPLVLDLPTIPSASSGIFDKASALA